nr:retrovirus-related Pol polyprotein from transposon TNT 1-94 [Tanacetum cinerariifolium]
MLADSLLPIPFWAEAVNTACYVQNRVLVTKPHNKTPYELLHGRTPSIGFIRPFGCPMTILNTLDSLGEFDEKNTDGDAAFNEKKPESKVIVFPSSSAQSKKQDDKTKREAKVPTVRQISPNSTNTFSVVGPSNVVASPTRGKSSFIDASQLPDDPDMPELEDITYSDDEDDVWVLVDLPHGKRAIGTKWVFKKKKDKRGIVVMNKSRLVAQRHTQEEGIEYEEVFAPVAWIEAIRLFLAYASFMGFMMYQMDIKSAFLYGTIKEEVYVYQPPGFEDLDHPDKVYKVVKALYGLHQASRVWYETLANYLLENGFQRGKIDQTMFIKRHKGDILLQKKDGIFISQDKYVAEILRKFGLTDGKSASTPIDTEKPLPKDPDGEDLDMHSYRLMIRSLMYLTSLKPDIMLFDSSLYASFIFDLSINPFSPVDRSDFYEFFDELIPFISPPEYDCFLFNVEPNSRDFTKDMVEDITPTKEPQVHNALPTHPTLQLNLKFQPSSEYLFTYVVWIFLPFLSSGSTNPQNYDGDDAFDGKEHNFDAKKPETEIILSPSSGAQSRKQDDKTKKEAKGKKADFNNLETSITVSPIPTTRVHKDHPVSQIIGDLSSTTQTRSMTRVVKDQGGLLQMFNDDFHTCMFACFLSQEEPKMEEGIDYKEVFALVARIEAIRLFLAYTSFMGFMVYQMDVNSAFLYGTIKEDVYVCQPPGFEDLDHPDKVYKVVKALYGLHQAPRAW